MSITVLYFIDGLTVFVGLLLVLFFRKTDPFHESIKSFCDLIIKLDLDEASCLAWQSKEWDCSGILRCALPWDRATGVRTNLNKQIFHDQLLEGSDNTDRDRFLDHLIKSRGSTDQDQVSIFTVAATSGVGKTHLAFSVGRKTPTVIIRVGVGTNQYSLPFNKLITALDLLDRERRENTNPMISYPELLEISSKAYTALKLLICCYMKVSMEVITVGKSTPKCDSNLLLLRFHRNVCAEKIVAELFEYWWSQACKKRSSCNDFIHEQMTAKGDLLLCFDEVQMLLGKYSELFFRTECFQSMKKGKIPEPVENSGIFYMLSMFLADICTQSNIRSCLTSTDSLIGDLKQHGELHSLKRSILINFELKKTHFGVADMKSIISHYFCLDELFLNNIEGWNAFIGRPYYFVQFMFKDFIFSLRSRDKNSSIKDLFSQSMKHSEASLQNVVTGRIKWFFKSLKSLNGLDNCTETVVALYPILIKNVLCGNGMLTLNENHHSVAISTMLIPVNSNEKIVVDLEQVEPTTFLLIREHLKDLLVRDFNSVFEVLLHSLRGSTGDTAEEALAYYFVLRVICHGPMTVRALFDPLIMSFSNISSDDDDLNNIVDCTEVVKLFSNASLTDVINCFVHDNKYVTKSVVIGLPQTMGVDLKLLTRRGTTDQWKVIAVQIKTGKNDIGDAMLTISPGLQFLTNVQRKFLLLGTEAPHKALTENPKEFLEFANLSHTYPELTTNWIRVAATSMKADEKKFTEALNVISHDNLLMQSYRESKLYLLSFSSENFLIERLRKYFFGSAALIDMNFPRNYRAICPVSVDKASELFHPIFSGGASFTFDYGKGKSGDCFASSIESLQRHCHEILKLHTFKIYRDQQMKELFTWEYINKGGVTQIYLEVESTYTQHQFHDQGKVATDKAHTKEAHDNLDPFEGGLDFLSLSNDE